MFIESFARAFGDDDDVDDDDDDDDDDTDIDVGRYFFSASTAASISSGLARSVIDSPTFLK